MEIESLGDAWSAGYRLRAKCAWGNRRDGLKSIRACSYAFELDLETLLWTRGKPFPVSSLSRVLKCPMCGSRHVSVVLIPPAGAPSSMPVRLVRGTT